MASVLNCSECGENRVQVTFGPSGFTQSCPTCGAHADLDELLEPVTHTSARRQLLAAA